MKKYLLGIIIIITLSAIAGYVYFITDDKSKEETSIDLDEISNELDSEYNNFDVDFSDQDLELESLEK